MVNYFAPFMSLESRLLAACTIMCKTATASGAIASNPLMLLLLLAVVDDGPPLVSKGSSSLMVSMPYCDSMIIIMRCNIN